MGSEFLGARAAQLAAALFLLPLGRRGEHGAGPNWLAAGRPHYHRYRNVRLWRDKRTCRRYLLTSQSDPTRKWRNVRHRLEFSRANCPRGHDPHDRSTACPAVVRDTGQKQQSRRPWIAGGLAFLPYVAVFREGTVWGVEPAGGKFQPCVPSCVGTKA